MITRQSKRIPKIHWNGWLTRENFDWLCHSARAEDRSIANLLNRIVKAARENGKSSTWNSDIENTTK